METFILEYGQKSQLLCFSVVERLIKKQQHCNDEEGTKANLEVGENLGFAQSHCNVQGICENVVIHLYICTVQKGAIV